MIEIKSNKIRWALSAVLALLILFGTYHSIFSLAAFAICALMLFFCDRESILLQIFFIMPMANIFKMSPGSQSFFTILILFYVVFHLVLPRKATLLVVLFALYVVIGELFAGSFDIFRTVKLICNLLFLSSTLNSEVKVRHKEIFLSFIVGNIVASTFGLMDSSLFKIESYIGVKALSANIEEGIVRFAGLYADPNYYSIGLIISLCLVVILYHRNELNTFFSILLLVSFVYFLLQTYSKSALFMLSLPFISFLYSLIKKKKLLSACFMVISVMLLVILAISGQIPALELVLERIEASETVSGTMDINALTTGRFELWVMYIKYLINNIKAAIFGLGINDSLLNGRAAHNTYLDIFYYMGVIGSSLLIAVLLLVSRQSRQIRIKRNLLNYSVIACIFIMYFFLSELFYFDPPFQLFIAFTVLNLPMEIDSSHANGSVKLK